MGVPYGFREAPGLEEDEAQQHSIPYAGPDAPHQVAARGICKMQMPFFYTSFLSITCLLFVYYKKTTAEITDEMAMNMLDTDMRNDYLALLNIADHSHIGKPRAILTAFKLGYLQGKSAHEPDMHDLDFQNVISEAALKLEKASIVLRTTIEANSLSKTDLTRDEMVAIGGCASNICDMMVVADDYVYHAQKELEGILE